MKQGDSMRTNGRDDGHSVQLSYELLSRRDIVTLTLMWVQKLTG